MRKITSLSLFILSACIALSHSVTAQIYVPAGAPETLLDAQFRINTNNAMIDYSPNCSTCGAAQLNAVCWGYNGGMPPGFKVTDGVSTPVTVTLPSNADETDIIIGNNTKIKNHYLVGVVYNYISTIGGVTVEIYDIANVGTGGTLTASLLSSQTIAPLKCNYPHIDIIAEYGNLFLGKPLCDRFVVCYDQNTPTSSIEGYYSSLNNPSSFTYQVMASSASSYYYGGNDVAAIQRKTVTGLSDMALFTYTQGSNIYYQEWDITNGTISSVVTLDPAATVPFPRIDAIDDYNINDPTVSNPLAYFNVVNLNSNGSWTSNQVINYNNKLPVGGLDISTPYLGTSGDPSFPRVTAGPCRMYTVAYPSRYITGCDILAQNIDWTTGYPTGYNSSLSNPFTNVRYYQVNFTYPGYGPSYATTVASTCNGYPAYAPYVSLAFNDLNTPSTLQFYTKMTTCKMKFKGEAEDDEAAPVLHWNLSPNPATDMLTLTVDASVQGLNYTITDITGRQLQQATLSSSREDINIRSLAPGMYVLNVFTSGNDVKRMKFVKE